MSLGAGVTDGGSGSGAGAGAGAGGAGAGAGGSAGAGGVGDGGNAGGAAAGSGSGGAAGSTLPPAAGAGSANLGDGGTGAKSWRDGLPDDLKADATLGKYSDVANLAKAHIELQKKFGQKGIFKPGPNASIEEIKAFRESLGIPTEADKYDMGKFEGVNIPPETVKWAQKMGADLGIEPQAFNKLMTEYLKLDASVQAGQKTQAENQMKTNLDGLKKEWGDAYDQNMKKANFAAEKLGGKPMIEALMKAGVHNDPNVIKAFVEASKFYREDTLREGGISNDRVSPAELDAKISSVQSRMFTMKPSDGAYAGLKAEFESLWKQKTGGR